MEYLIVVGLAFLVMVPATYFFFNFSKESSEEVSYFRIEAIGRTVVDTSESLFYTGEGSKTVINVNVPEGVEKATIVAGREMVFNVSSSAGYSDMVFFSRVNLTTGGSCQSSCIIEGLSDSGVRSLRLVALNST
ncbi:MAG TPA: hypothetical protein VJB12_03580, partial [Candidatus Nanoarchaeia archaeon]|nr:hypothetical protein [Candidatus Nanoarchaeia archaeon]